MAKISEMSEYARQKKRERDKIRNAKRPKKGRVLLTEEQKRERKRACDIRYNRNVKDKLIKSTRIALSESRRRFRTCRHEVNGRLVCDKYAAPNSYYFCQEHKSKYMWEDDPTLYDFKMPISPGAY